MINETLLERQEIPRDKLIMSPKITNGVTKKTLQDIVKDSFGVTVSEDYIPYLMQNNAYIYFRYEKVDDRVVVVGAAVVILAPMEGMPPHLVTLAVSS